MVINDTVKKEIGELVRKYEQAKSLHQLNRYSEEDTKKDFILPLFNALGWNTTNRSEVTSEESQSSGRLDYGFYIDEKPKFFLEAKSLKTDLQKEEYANQAVKYSWNKGVTWAVLTDFENLKVFNAQNIESSLSDKLFFDIPYTQFLTRFDQLWLLSKSAFSEDLLDKEAEKYGKKLQRVSVTSLLYKDLDKCRALLTNSLSQWNPKVEKDSLDEGVQKLLDRLIFLRVAEDRGIEPPALLALVREWDSKGGKDHLYQSMVSKFRELDEVYNSNLFSRHPFEKWEEYSGTTEQVINILYGRKGYYEYDFQAMPADILGGVYENYLGYRLQKSKKGISVSKDAKKRKEHGIYYTPDFVVDYIVKNTLKPELDKCTSISDLKKIKVLDPACGSGSFLIKALDVIYQKYLEFGSRSGTWTKINILLDNIYGVDLDPQAVEIARLNLLISALDKRMKLPILDKNIKNGNSLISGTDEELTKYFGKNFRDKKPFNWQEQFPEVFKQGGFDVIIGNPPWGAKFEENEKIFLSDLYSNKERGSESYIHFMEKALLLLRNNGLLGFILPNTWLALNNSRTIRKILLENIIVEIFQLTKQVFDSAPDIVPVILVVKKAKVLSNIRTKISIIRKPTFNFSKLYSSVNIKNLNQSIWSKGGSYVINLYKSNLENKLTNKIETDTIPLSTIAEVRYGIKTGDNERFLSKQITKYHKKKALKTGEIGRYKLYYKDLYLWWVSDLAGYRTETVEVPKIIIQYIRKLSLPRRLVAAFDSKGEYYPLNNYSYIIERDESYPLEYLLGILNSKLMNFYYANTYIDYNIKPFYLKKLPIKLLYPKNKEIFNSLCAMVKKILNLNNSKICLEENSEKWKVIKSEIEKTDKEIDGEVYRLYNLTPKEIEIIEKS